MIKERETQGKEGKKISRNDALRVSPAVTRLTVYRRLQVMTRQAFLRMQGLESNTNSPLRKPRVRRTYSQKMMSFFKKVEFFYISALFGQFFLLKHVDGKAHAKRRARL